MKQRHVGIELLRIIAMLMVLGLHINFMALPKITSDSILSFDGISRSIIQSFLIVAVNVFVMISGWFGIRPSWKGFCKFMWQVFFVVGISYFVETIFFNQSFTAKDFLRCFGLYYGGGWFVASYIGLYVISPILNSYIEQTPIKNIAFMLLAFFVFEFIWGNTLSVEFVVGEYSTFSFMGIYVLAGMLHKANFNLSSIVIGSILICSTLLNALLFIIAIKFDLVVIRDMLFNYINPLVIISASSLLLLFNKFFPPPPAMYVKRLSNGWQCLVLRPTYYMRGQNMHLLNFVMVRDMYMNSQVVLP